MRRVFIAAIACLFLFFGMSHITMAAGDTKGLSMSPLRLFVDSAAGMTTAGTVTVGNLTTQPMTVSLSYEQFSVADYSYDYQFSAARENWLTLQPAKVQLTPGTTQTVSYHLSVPEHATPGGHYFTIFASASLDAQREERVAAVMYVTVAGALVRSSTVSQASIPSVVLSGDIPFSLDVKNTGNTHYFMYTSGKLSGLSAAPSSNEVAHILLPQTTRTVTGSIAAPLLPGLYTASYGYRTEDGQHIDRSALIVYIPLWFWPLLVGGVWLIVTFVRRHKRHMKL